MSNNLYPQLNMETSDETIIRLSKKKLALFTLVLCACVAVGAWMRSLDAAEIRHDHSFHLFGNEPAVVYVFGLVMILLSAAIGLFCVKKLFDKRPGLVLNSSGVVDNASAFSAGFIPWSDVAGARVHEIQGRKILVVNLRDPRKYADRGGALRRVLNRANSSMIGSPVAIPSTALEVDFEKLVSLFFRYQQKYCARDAASEG